MEIATFPKAIVFDMDGLMLNSEVIFHKAWQTELIELLGYDPLDNATYLQLIGRSNDQAENVLRQLLGADFPIDRFRTGWTTRWEKLAQDGIPLKPGLIPLLDWLDKTGLPKVVGTSSNGREADIALKGTGLWSRFNGVVTFDNAGVGKPAPDIFLMAAKLLNVSPVDCLVLEDSNAGVQAAINAGMKAIMVPDLQTPTAYSQHHTLTILPSLHDVLVYLQQMWTEDTKS